MPDAHLVPLSCPNCGAALSAPATDVPQPIACRYCEHRMIFEPHRQTIAPFAAPFVAPNLPRAPAARSRVGIVVGVTAAMVGLAVSASIVGFSVSARKMRDQLHSPAAVPGKPPGYVQPPTRVIWDDVGGAPVPVAIAGAEAVCGRLRALTDRDQLTFACFDAKTVTKRWETAQLGAYSDAYGATRFAIAGDRFVYSDRNARVHVLDVETGRELGAVTVTDRVDELCATGPHALWIRVADHRNVALDVAKIAAADSAREPASCPLWKPANVPPGAPAFSGFAARTFHVAGDLGVTGGVKSPGTELPRAIGFDPKTRQQRWQVALGASGQAIVREASGAIADALIGDRYMAVYGVGPTAWRVAAYDARSGAALWDIALPSGSVGALLESFAAGERYFYVAQTGTLTVIEPQSGAIVGKIGDAL